MLLCKCDCGNIRVVEYDKLRSGRTVSCGCYQKEIAAKIITERATTHKMSRTRIYKIYRSMYQRCYNKNDTGYISYGGRGIYICDEWLKSNDNPAQGFVNFMNWAYNNGYYDQPKDTPKKDRLTIDRIDNDGPYAPWNCRWVTAVCQNSNKRNNRHIIDLDNEILTHTQFEEKHNLPKRYIPNRLKSGWSISAIIYSVYSKIEIVKKGSRWYGWEYCNKDGLKILIPTIKQQKIMFGFS